ncbi:MAG: hypothetical protein HRU20_02885 [Pseudomonadales bacterium]|nr:hypothetical protein [Pseudomonadales bacterium]
MAKIPAYSLFSVWLLLFCQPSLALLSKSEEEALTPHYAFSNYFGSGLYSSSGQDLMVINLPITYEPEQSGQFKYRFRLPVSLGFYDYGFDEIGDIEIPDSVASLTLTAGIEFDHWVNNQLKLVPFIDFGISENLQRDERAVIYASGITAEYSFNAWQEQHVWLTRFQRAGYNAQSEGISDGFSALETGVDLIMPWSFSVLNRPMFFSTYAMHYWYFIDLVFNPETINPKHKNNAQEVGVTFGFDKPLDMFFFDLERVGLGIRRTNNFYVTRLLFNFPLD